MKKKPIIDPLSSEMQKLLAKPRLTAGTATPTLTPAATTRSPTDTLATVDPLARYTDAIKALPNDKEILKVRDKLPGFTTSPFPDWTPQNLEDLYDTSVQYDNKFFRKSDQDFARRNPALRESEIMFQNRVRQEQGGDFRLSPAVRDAFLTTGLEGALGTFGDTPGTIRSGSAAEAAIGRSLAGPEGILGFQNRNRANALESLTLAENLFPHRQIGFGGETAVGITKENVENENIALFSEKAYDTGLDLFNWQIHAGNINQSIEQRNLEAKAISDRLNAGATADASKSAADAQKKAAAVAAGAAIVGAVLIAFT